jgi:GntR family transcriptional regulator
MLGLRRAQRRAVAAAPHGQAAARRGNEEHDGGDGVATVATPGALAGFPDQGLRRLDLSRIGVGGEARVECHDCLLVSQSDDASLTSIMLDVKVDPSEPTDLHTQVAAEIRRAIADGEATAGERLPPARDLAAELGVNTNTVLRALRALRDEGLLEFRRGRGITVTGTPDRSAVIAKATELARMARQHGYRQDELLEIVRSVS